MLAARPEPVLVGDRSGLIYWTVKDRTMARRGESAVVSALGMTYGRCPCTGWYESRSVEVRMQVDSQEVVLTDVPQGACPRCGGRVYKADILEILEVIRCGEAGRHSGAP